MKKLLMAVLMMAGLSVQAQVKVENGPALENDRDSKMNRMLGGDDNSFYCYRIKTRGKGTSFFVEKYSKKTLKAEFSKEITVEDAEGTKIEDVEYAAGSVFIFRREFIKKSGEMVLYYQNVSSKGVVSNKMVEITTIKSDHYEFVDFDVCANPAKTKFLVKACHKANKTAKYSTDFMMLEAATMKISWTKTVNEKLSGSNGFWSGAAAAVFGIAVSTEDLGFIGMFLDDADNMFYCSTTKAKGAGEKEKRYTLNLGSFSAGSTTPMSAILGFDQDYYVSDIEFSQTKENEVVIGGFLKDVIERKGRDLVQVGIFSFRVNKSDLKINSKAIKIFDDKILKALESTPAKSKRYKYKLDYIFSVGSDVYYVGEQYEWWVQQRSSSYGYAGTSSSTYEYEYMDVIVAKLNSKGEFEWVKNAPLRNHVSLNSYPHVFKQYLAYATSKNIYILCDEHPKNMERYEKADFEPKDLKTVSGIHGSNFVSTAISVTDGKITHQLVFENKDYCFAPIQERNMQFMPPEDTEIFVPSSNNELFIYTEDRGRDRFSRIILE